jgi:hypothetical protein
VVIPTLPSLWLASLLLLLRLVVWLLSLFHG